MSPRLAELTAHAQALTSSGDLCGARDVLAEALAPMDTDPVHASPALAEAAALQARILIALGDAVAARGWADFAHTALRRLYGPDDQRALAATATNAAVLHRVGDHALAAELYRDVVGQVLAADGPDSVRVLAAQADLATTEHAAGECADARARLAAAWQRHRRQYGDAAPAGIKMLARLGAMERDCGRTVEAREHLALAGEYCARYLPGDHVLVRQIARLTRDPVPGPHRCGSDESLVTGAYDFPPEEPPGVTALAAAPPAPADPFPFGLGEHEDPGLGEPVHPPGVEAPHPRRPLAMAAVLTTGAVIAAATVALTLHTGEATPRGAAPSAVPAPGSPSTVRGAAPTSAGSQPSVSAPAAIRVLPPAGVSLRDTRDSVTLRWTYPDGSEGPVVISGGRTGQDPRAFQQLPAGTTDYVVYGLNQRADYCFTVAVVYAADSIATAKPICTSRTG